MSIDINQLVLESLTKHKIYLDNYEILEGVYWETPNIDISMGYLLYENISSHCLILDNLHWFSDISPKLLLISHNLKILNTKNLYTECIILPYDDSYNITINDTGNTNFISRWNGIPKSNYTNWLTSILTENILLTNFYNFEKSKPLSLDSNSQLLITNVHVDNEKFIGNVIRKQ